MCVLYELIDQEKQSMNKKKWLFLGWWEQGQTEDEPKGSFWVTEIFSNLIGIWGCPSLCPVNVT